MQINFIQVFFHWNNIIFGKIIKKLVKAPRQGALVLALQGELGAGKTTFVQGLAQALGVKEKVLAAHRAGIKTIILPFENKKDLIDVPAEIKKAIKFVFVKTAEDALKIAFK